MPVVEIEYARRLAEAERGVKVKVMVELNQAQFDAIVSFTSNTTNVTNNRTYQALNDDNFEPPNLSAHPLIFGSSHDRISRLHTIEGGPIWQ